jgi:hypothetical protein
LIGLILINVKITLREQHYICDAIVSNILDNRF